MWQLTKTTSQSNLEIHMGRSKRFRLIEVGLAFALTLVAVLFVAMAVWAEEPGSINISGAWARPTLGDTPLSAAYMTIKNTGQMDDVLKAAKSPAAKRVEIHETTMGDAGVMRMRPLTDGLPIPAGGEAQLEPGGAHVMLMGLSSKLNDGETLSLTLEFEKAGTIELTVPIGKPASEASSDEMGSGDHSGHH